MRHHTKNKGDLGALKAQADLSQQGCIILYPLTEHAPFDLVAYRDGIFYRVQVKYRSLNSHGTITFPYYTSWTDKNGTHMRPIYKNEIDLCCIYCPETDECYYFQPQENKRTFALRVKPPRNSQKKHIRFASEFRRIP